MNFKEFYYNIFYPRIITEDYESVIKQIKNMINNNGLAPESIDNILDIYNNASVDEGREKAKKDSDLVALTYMYMVGENIGLSIDEIKREYSSYLNSETSVGKKLLSEYVTNLQNEIKSKGLFKPDKKADKLELIKSKTIDLLETIHRYQKKEEFSGKIINEENDKVYEDKDIVVFRADSKAKCIYYGKNTNLCISTKSGNYYWKYRMGKMRPDDGLGMTTYFVIPKDRVGNELIVIDAMGNERSSNTFGYTIVEPSGKQIEDLYNISKDKLENKFPVLQKPFDNNIFKFIPYAEKEKRFQWIEETVRSASQLDNYEDYEMWIQTDNEPKSDDWKVIEKKLNDKEMKKLLLLASELVKHIPLDLTEKYFSEKEKERYLNKIAESPDSSYAYATEVLYTLDVPEILVQSIAKNAIYSHRYAKDLNLIRKNIPDIIINGIAQNSHESYMYARNELGGKNVPDIIIQSIARDIDSTYGYIRYVLEGQNVPEILVKTIAKNSNYSYVYAKDILKGQNVPEILVQSIAQDTRHSYYYARDVLKGQNVPDIILQSIARNPEYSHYYAIDVLKGQNVPDIIIQGISKDSFYSYSYTKAVLTEQNVPDIILQSIAKNPNYSYFYAKDVLKGQNVPEILVKTIAKDSNFSYLYAKNVLKGQNVPDIILQSIARDPEYSQQSLTEATLNSLSTNVIRSNSQNINSIENRNFSAEYSADASSVIRDSRMDGFIGEGIFDDSDKIAGYGYGYRMGADGEYDELEYIDTNDITFFSDKFKQSVVENGIENICTPENTFYISNLVVDKPYRLYVKPLLNALLNRISSEGYKYIAFDGLSDTIRLFDSTRKASRLSSNKLIKLAEVDGGESKLVLFYIG